MTAPTLSVAEAARISSKYTPTVGEKAFHRQLSAQFKKQDAEGGFDVGKEGTDVGIELLDRMINVVDLDVCSVDIWMEDERDILMQALPVKGGRAFTRFELARQQWDKVMGKVFRDVPGVQGQGEFFGGRYGDWKVSRKSNMKDAGRDMFQVRLVGLWLRPRAAEAAVEAIRLFDRILAGLELPVE